MENSLIGPVLGQVILTFVAWLVLYVRRLKIMAAAKPTNEQMQDKSALAQLPNPAKFAAENYNHQFEMPVLFYVICFAAMTVGASSALMVYLAWGYVALRVIHHLIHVNYNNVIHRFLVFSVSSIVLIIMLANVAVTYWS